MDTRADHIAKRIEWIVNEEGRTGATFLDVLTALIVALFSYINFAVEETTVEGGIPKEIVDLRDRMKDLLVAISADYYKKGRMGKTN